MMHPHGRTGYRRTIVNKLPLQCHLSVRPAVLFEVHQHYLLSVQHSSLESHDKKL
jgi:hypothetical protein